jgi:hypothetical protein
MNPLREFKILYKFCRKHLGLNRLRSIVASMRGDVTIMCIGAAGSAQGTYPLAPVSLTTTYSQHKDSKYLNAMGVWLMATSPGSIATPNLKIQVEQSYIAPTTEGTADANWVIGDGVPDVYTNLNDSIAHIKTLALVPMKKYRLKVTGLGSNPPDCQLLCVLFQQELVA